MKKLLVIITVLFDLLAIGIIPLNLYCFQMPEFISIILGAVIIILNVFVWIKIKKKTAGKVVLSLLSVVFVLLSLFGTFCNPYWNSITKRNNASLYSKAYDYVLTYDEAAEDFEYAMKYLNKLHPALYDGMTSEIEAQYEVVKENLKKYEQITVCDLSREIESIFARIGDGHTYVMGYYEEPHILKYIYEHNEAGDSLIKLDGTAIDDLLKANKQYYSYESEAAAKNSLVGDISILEGMTYLGFNLDKGVLHTYETKDGREESYTYYTDDYLTYQEYAEFNNLENSSNEEYSFVSYEIDAENDIAILYLDSCDNNDEYRAALKNMFTEIKENNIKNVAVDLRYNGGGDSSVATEFLKYIDVDAYKEWGDIWRFGIFEFENKAHVRKNEKIEDLLFDGNVYILTSVNTFSSAMDFAMYIGDNDLGTIIGEASGNDPNSYGQVAQFKLPNSEIFMQISTKKWYRIDMETTDRFIEPDIKCDSKDALDELYKVIGKLEYDLEHTSDIVVSDEAAREINEHIEGWTEAEILNLSEEMLISLGQLVLCDKLDNQAVYYPFGEKIGVGNPYEMSIAQQSADGETSARQIAEAYYTPENDSYWFNDFLYIGETDLFWMYLSYYNNNNVKDKPRYCLVFNKEYFDYENSIFYGDLTEAGIKEFFSLYKVPNIGTCIGNFVHEADTRFEYVSYYISICYGDYGLNDSVMLVKYCWNIDKDTQVVQLVSDMESIMESEIPGTMHEEPEIEFDDVD